MGKLRDHEPIIIDEFNGLYRRGLALNTPLDHFQDCENVRFTSSGDVITRDGIGISQSVIAPLANIKRIYNYPTQTANTLIILTYNAGTNTGSIYHLVDAATIFGPLLSIVGMTDFAFLPFDGRAYISPFSSFANTTGQNIEKGLSGEFLYVYKGDGTLARKAGGDPLSGGFNVTNGAAGNTDAGFHRFSWVLETDTGFLSSPGTVVEFVTLGNFSVSFNTIPLPNPSPPIVARHLVATKALASFNGDLFGAQFFFVPNASITNNALTVLNNISFFDADLIEDASHLLDNFINPPAGAVLTLYHERLSLLTTFTDISIGYCSAQGEPEAISQVDGLIIVPPDGNPITNAIELRDILYVTKRSRTVSFTDNGDAPSSWPLVPIDTGLGTCVHGIATVLDSGGSSVDYLIIATYQGISLFNGRFIAPELSWKIEDYWKGLDRNEFRKIQIINAPIQREIYIVLPTRKILVGNYSNDMDPKKIRWSPWSYLMGVNTVAIKNIDEIIVGADLP